MRRYIPSERPWHRLFACQLLRLDHLSQQRQNPVRKREQVLLGDRCGCGSDQLESCHVQLHCRRKALLPNVLTEAHD